MDNMKWGLTTLALVLAAFGAGTLTPEQIDNVYNCSVTGEIGIFTHLSSTGKTGYWNESGVTKSKVCTNGVWNKITLPKQDIQQLNSCSETIGWCTCYPEGQT